MFNFLGDGMWTDLQTDINNVEVNYNQMSAIESHKTNASQLEKFATVFKV